MPRRSHDCWLKADPSLTPVSQSTISRSTAGKTAAVATSRDDEGEIMLQNAVGNHRKVVDGYEQVGVACYTISRWQVFGSIVI